MFTSHNQQYLIAVVPVVRWSLLWLPVSDHPEGGQTFSPNPIHQSILVPFTGHCEVVYVSSQSAIAGDIVAQIFFVLFNYLLSPFFSFLFSLYFL